MTEKIMTRLRFDNDTKNKVVTLVKMHDSPITLNDISPDRKRVKKIMSQIGEDLIFDLIEIKYCDNSAQNPEYFRGENFYKECREIVNEILSTNECFSIKHLAINGNDLIALGFKGKKIGEALEKTLTAVIDGKVKNEKSELFEYIKK